MKISIASLVIAQNSALLFMMRFFFLLSNMKASIFSLLNERLLLVLLAKVTLTYLQAIQLGNKISSSEACLLNCSEVESADKLCFSRNCSKTNTKLLALSFQVFGVAILVAMLILTVI